MKDIIRKNLEIFLDKHKTFKEQCEVVYLLVEIRKLVEDDKKNFKTLYFYCCWIAHSNMYHDLTATILSSKFDNLIDLHKKKTEIQHDLINGQPDFFKLKDLKDELTKFLNNENLPISFLGGNSWHMFCTLFLTNIAECTIDISKSKVPHKINKLMILKNSKNYSYKFELSNGIKIPGILIKYKIV